MAAGAAKVLLTFSGTEAEGRMPADFVFAPDATQADILAAYYRRQQCAVRLRAAVIARLACRSRAHPARARLQVPKQRPSSPATRKAA